MRYERIGPSDLNLSQVRLMVTVEILNCELMYACGERDA